MEYKLIANKLSTKDLLKLRESAGWSILTEKQAEAGIKGSLYSVTAICNDKVIGIGRLVGDGFTVCYIQDIIVLPEFQGKGVGTAIMKKLIAYIKNNAIPNSNVTVGLFSAKGREGFYEKFGFYTRPNDNRGAGMMMSIEG